MSKPNENDPINQGLRRAFTSARFTLDAKGRVIRGPNEEPASDAGPDVPAALGKSDAGARGDVPTDPAAAVNAAIRKALAGRG